MRFSRAAEKKERGFWGAIANRPPLRGFALALRWLPWGRRIVKSTKTRTIVWGGYWAHLVSTTKLQEVAEDRNAAFTRPEWGGTCLDVLSSLVVDSPRKRSVPVLVGGSDRCARGYWIREQKLEKEHMPKCNVFNDCVHVS